MGKGLSCGPSPEYYAYRSRSGGLLLPKVRNDTESSMRVSLIARPGEESTVAVGCRRASGSTQVVGERYHPVGCNLRYMMRNHCAGVRVYFRPFQ